MKRVTFTYTDDNKLSSLLAVIVNHMPFIRSLSIEDIEEPEPVINSFHRSRVEQIAKATGEDSFRLKKLAAKGKKLPAG